MEDAGLATHPDHKQQALRICRAHISQFGLGATT
jgi:hypothetical protein